MSLHVYGAGCAWSGPIEKVGKLPMQGAFGREGISLPCCPHCKGTLFQTDETEWWSAAAQHDDRGHANYLEFMRWKEAKGKCWPSLKLAGEEFERETGKAVKWDL